MNALIAIVVHKCYKQSKKYGGGAIIMHSCCTDCSALIVPLETASWCCSWKSHPSPAVNTCGLGGPPPGFRVSPPNNSTLILWPKRLAHM